MTIVTIVKEHNQMRAFCFIDGCHFPPRGLRGSSGYGDALKREPEQVRQDVLSQFISFERARDVYGVVFAGTELTDALAVDEAGTERMREGLWAGR